METDEKYPYLAPTTEVVEVGMDTSILQSSSTRGGYGDSFDF